MTDKQDKYPNYPPFDSQIVFYTGSSLRMNPTGPAKMAKTCPKCQCPIQVRICIQPCQHYLCYECYAYNKQECAYCSTVACQAVQLDDRQVLFSCDTECYKVFQNEEQLQKHMDDHVKMKATLAKPL